MASYETKKRWTRADGEQALDDVDASGLSDRAFGDKHGLCVQRLSKWRGKLGRPRSAVGKANAEARPAAAASNTGTALASGPQFVEVRATQATAAAAVVEIKLRNGRSVAVSIGSRADDLGALLNVVEGTVC